MSIAKKYPRGTKNYAVNGKIKWGVDPVSNIAYLEFPDGTTINIGENSPLFLQAQNDILNLQNNEFKILYYEIIDISFATSGSVTLPSGATIIENEFGESGDSVLSEINAQNKPTLITPTDGTGNYITVNIDTDGSWIASDNYANPVALIYVITIKGQDIGNLDVNRIDVVQLFGDEKISDNLVSGTDIDWSKPGGVHYLDCTGNPNITFSNVINGKMITVWVKNVDGVSDPVWPAMKWSGSATQPVLTQTAGKYDIFTFIASHGQLAGNRIPNF